MSDCDLSLLTEELEKHGISAERIDEACLSKIVACARTPVQKLESTDETANKEFFAHILRGLATHVAGLLGAFGPGWPVPKDDVISGVCGAMACFDKRPDGQTQPFNDDL
jgi:hypothetical protein